jgi:hypothetical protein
VQKTPFSTLLYRLKISCLGLHFCKVLDSTTVLLTETFLSCYWNLRFILLSALLEKLEEIKISTFSISGFTWLLTIYFCISVTFCNVSSLLAATHPLFCFNHKEKQEGAGVSNPSSQLSFYVLVYFLKNIFQIFFHFSI